MHNVSNVLRSVYFTILNPSSRWLRFLCAFVVSIISVWGIQFSLYSDQPLSVSLESSFSFFLKPVAFLNVIIVLFIFYLIFAITNRFLLGIPWTFFIAWIFARFNQIKNSYRGTGLGFFDLSQLGDPAGLLQFVPKSQHLDAQIFIVLILVLISTGLSFRSERHGYLSWVQRLLVIGLFLVLLIGFRSSVTKGSIMNSVFKTFGYQNKSYSLELEKRLNGGLLNFAATIDDSTIMKKPADYSKKRMQEIETKYNKLAIEINDERENNLNDETVVFILSESFSDPNRVPGLKFQDDDPPIYDILEIKEGTTSGLMMADGFGGGTANTEWEALTGLSIAFLDGSLQVPFNQIMPKQKTTETAVMQWFDTRIGIGGTRPVLYDRIDNYDKLGITTYYNRSLPNLIPYTNRVTGNSDYTSDQSMYQNTLSVINKAKKPQFIDMNTIQNHVPYESDTFGSPYWKMVSPKKSSNLETEEINRVNSYAEGVHITAMETKKFIADLDNIDKPITVVWYGDHLPGIYLWDGLSPNQISLHQTDYFIYSNKASKSHEMKTPNSKITSANYFPAQLAEHTNSKVSPFVAMLTEAHQAVPAIWRSHTTAQFDKSLDGVVGFDNNGKVIRPENYTSDQIEVLNDYRMVEYDLTKGDNYLRSSDFFTVKK